MPNVTAERTPDHFRLFIDGYLHLHIPLANYAGLQAFIEGEDSVDGALYGLQIYLKRGRPIRCDYLQRALWLQILDVVNTYL